MKVMVRARMSLFLGRVIGCACIVPVVGIDEEGSASMLPSYA